MNKDQVLGIVRHVLTFGGGFLAAKGWTDAAGIDQIAGAVVTLVGALWSILAKKQAS